MNQPYCPFCDTWGEDPQNCSVCAAREQAHQVKIQAERKKRLEYEELKANPPTSPPISRRDKWIKVEAQYGHYAWCPVDIAGHYEVFSDMRGGLPRAGTIEPGFKWQLTELQGDQDIVQENCRD